MSGDVLADCAGRGRGRRGGAILVGLLVGCLDISLVTLVINLLFQIGKNKRQADIFSYTLRNNVCLC